MPPASAGGTGKTGNRTHEKAIWRGFGDGRQRRHLAGASAAPDSIDSHLAAAPEGGVGTDFSGTLARTCITPSGGSDDAAARRRPGAAAVPRPIPARETWYAEPMKVFDNLYWVGTKVHSSWAIKTSQGIILIDTLYNYASEPEIVEGLKKLGLDPASIKYVIVTHGHGDHDEGAKLLQDKFGTHVVMGGPDWDSITKANNMAGEACPSATSSPPMARS